MLVIALSLAVSICYARLTVLQGIHIEAFVDVDAETLTAIHSPAFTGKPDMEKDAFGTHSHHADALCWPLELS
jgi:hypothetical protein